MQILQYCGQMASVKVNISFDAFSVGNVQKTSKVN
jgi:hypothetical protein